MSNKPYCFVQWKGTNVCMDVHCTMCGAHTHYDGYCFGRIKCGKCGTHWKLDLCDIPLVLDPTPIHPTETSVYIPGEDD